MFGRRLLVLVAVLMGLTALAASLAPPPASGPGARGTPSPTPGPPATATAAPPPVENGTVTAHLSAARSASPREVTATQGELVNLTISGDVVDTVDIAGLSVLEPIDPESPALVQLFADTPGRFPIRLLDSGRLLGTLRISR